MKLLPLQVNGHERSDPEPSRFLVPPGYSRLKIRETAEVREIDLVVPNEAMEHLTEFFPLLMGPRLSGKWTNGSDNRIELTGAVGTVVPGSTPPAKSTGTRETNFKLSPPTTEAMSAMQTLVPLPPLPAMPTGVREMDFKLSPPRTESISAMQTLVPLPPPPAMPTNVRETDFKLSSPPPQPMEEEKNLDSASPTPQLQPSVKKTVTSARKWLIAAVVAIAMAMSVLDDTIISVTLPQMQRAFHTDFATITWVATIYFLAQAAVIPVVGYLSDRIGSKRVFLTSLSLFTVGSLLCALAPTKEALFAFRAIQGIGGGAIFPLAFTINFRVFRHDELGKATALLGVPILMAPAFGPTLGGYLSTTFDWYAVFIINVPIGIVALIMASLVLLGRTFEQTQQIPDQAQGASKRFDILGLLLSIAASTLLTYGIGQAGTKGWSSQTVLTSLLIGVGAVIVLIVVELLVSDPVIDPRLFKNYTFSISNLLFSIIIGVFFGGLFLLPFFFENVQGHSALTTGEFLMIQGITTGVGVAISGTLYNRVGPRILAIIGVILLATGTYLLTQIETNTTGQSLQIALAVRGLGTGLVFPPLQTLALSALNGRVIAKASSLMTILRQLASAIGVAALTTYLTQQTTTHATDIGNALRTGLQTHHLSGVAATCVQAAGPTQNLKALNTCVFQHAATLGVDDTFWIVMIIAACCTLLAVSVGRDLTIEAYKKAKARGEKVELKSQQALGG